MRWHGNNLLMCLVALVSLTVLVGAALADDAAPTQDDLGIFHGQMNLVNKPLEAHDRPDMDRIRAMCVTPDGKKIVVEEWRHDKDDVMDRVVVIDVATAKIDRVLTEQKGRQIQPGSLKINGDGKSVILNEPEPGGLAQYDLATGKITKRYQLLEGKSIGSIEFSGDGNKFAAPTDDGGALLWDVASEKPTFVKLAFVPKDARSEVFPLSKRNELLVAVSVPKGFHEGKINFLLFDPSSAKTTALTEFAGNADIRTTADGKRAYIFRQEDPQQIVWTAIEEWDLVAAKQIKKTPLNPPMSSIGLKLSQDGNTLFLHEYLTQPVVLWNLKEGKFAALLGPDGGGCEAFDITPDGKRVVAFVGPWIEGTLSPNKLAVYDTSSYVGTVAKK